MSFMYRVFRIGEQKSFKSISYSAEPTVSMLLAIDKDWKGASVFFKANGLIAYNNYGRNAEVTLNKSQSFPACCNVPFQPVAFELVTTHIKDIIKVNAHSNKRDNEHSYDQVAFPPGGIPKPNEIVNYQCKARKAGKYVY